MADPAEVHVDGLGETPIVASAINPDLFAETPTAAAAVDKSVLWCWADEQAFHACDGKCGYYHTETKEEWYDKKEARATQPCPWILFGQPKCPYSRKCNFTHPYMANEMESWREKNAEWKEDVEYKAIMEKW